MFRIYGWENLVQGKCENTLLKFAREMIRFCFWFVEHQNFLVWLLKERKNGSLLWLRHRKLGVGTLRICLGIQFVDAHASWTFNCTNVTCHQSFNNRYPDCARVHKYKLQQPWYFVKILCDSRTIPFILQQDVHRCKRLSRLLTIDPFEIVGHTPKGSVLWKGPRNPDPIFLGFTCLRHHYFKGGSAWLAKMGLF